MADITGNNLDETIPGTSGADSIEALGGNDIVTALSGDDTVIAGEGNDVVDGDVGADSIEGNAGGDRLNGGSGDDFIDGGTEADTIYGEAGNDTLLGGEGNDSIGNGFNANQSGDDSIDGGSGNDYIYDPYGDNTITGGQGNDTLIYASGDLIDGGSGDDSIYYYLNSGGDVTVSGGDGNDRFYDYGGSNATSLLLDGEAGNDYINGDNGSTLPETILGGSGDDTILGNAGDDSIDGEDGNDSIYDGTGNDTVNAGDGDDWMQNQQGNDLFDGGSGGETTGDTLDLIGDRDRYLLIDNGGGSIRIIDKQGTYGDDTVTNVETLTFDDQTVSVAGLALGTFTEGGSGDNSIDGTAGTDILDGQAGNDTLNGLGEGDSILGGDGNDSLTGGDGADVLHGQADMDDLSGDADNDTLYGGAGTDTLAGGSGDDSLMGGQDNDTILGGVGNDRIGDGFNSNQSGDDSIEGGAGSDYIYDPYGDNTIRGEAGNDTLIYASGDLIDGGSGDDSIYYYLNSGGDVTVTGGDGNDHFYDYGGSNATSLLLDGGAGNDSINGDNNASLPETILGGSGDDTIHGNTGNDSVDGESGNDSINGNNGVDTLHGGSGDDTIDGGNDNDSIFGGAGADIITGGAGDDTIDGGTPGGAGTIVRFSSNSTNYTITTGAQGEATVSGPDGTDVITGTSILRFPDTDVVIGANPGTAFNGTSGDDTFDGGEGDDTAIGAFGDDTFNGNGGADSLVGDEGDDDLFGGLGEDTISGGDNADSILGGEGNDDLFGGSGNDTIGNGFNADQEGHDSIEGGAGSDYIYDPYGDNTIRGEAGNDTLIYASGDLIDGGSGDDSIYYYLNSGGDVTVSGGEGNDRFYDYGGSNATSLLLDGGEGNDSINGDNNASLPETILGGLGNDTILGNAGDDSIVGGSGDDSIHDGTGNDTVEAGEGDDWIQNQQGNDLFDGGTGNESLGDTLDLIGNRDRYIILDNGGGSLRIIDKQGTYGDDTVTNVENLSFDDQSVQVSSLSLGVLTEGGSGDNSIDGTPGTDILDGQAGNDTINGLGDGDSILGGSGDDSLFGGEGADVIRGHGDADELFGEAGNDTLDGGEGSDTLTGGSGDDSLLGGADNDTLLGGVGNDTIGSGFNTSQSGDDSIEGGEGNDYLYDPYGDNTIRGEAGNDTLIYASGDLIDGGSGDDSIYYYLNSGGDVTVSGGDGNDRFYDYGGSNATSLLLDGGAGNDSINGDNNASLPETILGGSGDDTLLGNTGNDSVDGGEGNDDVRGGAGEDTLLGGDGDDIFNSGNHGSGNDTIDGGADNSGSGSDGDIAVYRGARADYSVVGSATGLQVINNSGNGDGIDVVLNVERLRFSDGDVVVSTGLTGAIVNGSTGNDSLVGTILNDTITGLAGDDTIVALAGIDDIDAGAGDDTIEAGTENDSVLAGSGDDTIEGGAGDDTIDGGDGLDTAVFSGDFADYTITGDSNAATVTGPDGTDILTNIRILQFDDQTFAFNNAPTVANDAASTNEDTFVNIPVADILANDSDTDGDPLSVDSVQNVLNGSAFIFTNASGTFIRFSPDSNFNGTASFEVNVTDGFEITTSTVTVSVASVNDAPITVNDAATTAEDIAVNIDVVANDSDVEDGTPTVSAIGATPNGAAVIEADGTITFTPNADFNGVTAFNYTVTDSQGATRNGTVTVTVTPVNDDPVAADNVAVTNANTAVEVDVLANDSDVDGDTLAIDSVSTPSNGTAVIDDKGTADTSDDTIVYTPNSGFSGNDSFTYTISDGNGGTDVAAVAVTIVAPTNADPVAADDIEVTSEDTPVIVSVLTNDTDADGDTLTISGITQGTNGLVVDNGDGTVTYTPNPDFNGPDSFTYTVSDGNGGTDVASVVVTVISVNDLPVAADDSATTLISVPVVIDVLANDSDVEGAVTLTGIATAAANGTAVDNGDGTVTYTPNAAFTGTDTFTYTIEDGNGATETATVTVNVTAAGDIVTTFDSDLEGWTTINDANGLAWVASGGNPDGHATATDIGTGQVWFWSAPAAYLGNKSPYYGGSFSYDLKQNSLSSQLDQDDIRIVGANGTTIALDLPHPGTDWTEYAVSLSTLSDWRIGSEDGAVATMADIQGVLADIQNIYIRGEFINGADNSQIDNIVMSTAAAPINQPPEAVLDQAATQEDTPVNIGVVLNDTDPEGDPLTVTAVTQGTNGTVAINPDGTVRYTPNADFNGLDSFTYTISDGNGNFDAGTVNVNVTPVNDAPEATADAATTDQDVAVDVNVLLNDTDVDGDTLTVSAVTQGTNGGVAINPDGTVRYTPDGGFSGTDTFTYTVSDGNGGTDTETVTVTINPVIPNNDDPIAVADSGGTDEDAPVTLNLIGNDSDPDGDPLSISSVSQPFHGTVINNGDGTVTYRPYQDYNGPDSFTYTVSDGNGGTDTATVNITVGSINDDPVAGNDQASTLSQTPVVINVLANDSDVEGAVSIAAVGIPPNGAAVANADGTITYTPNGGFTGIDTFSYAIIDGDGATDTATVTVNVQPGGVSAKSVAPLVVEGTGGTGPTATFLLERNIGLTDTVTVTYTIVGAGFDQVGADDIVGGTFPIIGTATFNPGETSISIDLPIIPDATPEAHETMRLTITTAVDTNGAAVPIIDPQEMITIVNDDGPYAGGGSDGDPDTGNDGTGTPGDPNDPGTPGTSTGGGNGTGTGTGTGTGSGTTGPGGSGPIPTPPTPPGPPRDPGDKEADVWGDPHLVTFDGARWDFQAVGEFIATMGTEAGDDFEIQVRFTPFGGSSTISSLGAVATEIDGVTVAIYRDDQIPDGGTQRVLIDGVETEIDPYAGPVAVGSTGGEIWFDGNNGYRIIYPNGEQIMVKTFGSYMNMCVFTDDDFHPDNTTLGLLGNGDGNSSNEVVLPDGTVLDSPTFNTIYGPYADAWRISDATSFFTYDTGEGTADFTDTDFPAGIVRISDFPQEAIDAATAIVDAQGIANPILRDAAILDVLISGDPALAEASDGLAADPTEQGTPAETPTFDATTITSLTPYAAEGATGETTVFQFQIVRIGDASAPVDVDWQVIEGTADADDFVGGTLPSGTVSFAADQATAIIEIEVSGDATPEFDEIFRVQITSPDGVYVAQSSQGIIVNDDGPLPSTFQVYAAEYSNTEGTGTDGSVTFLVTRGNSTLEEDTVTIEFATDMDAADFGSGSLPTPQLVTFLPGEDVKFVTIAIEGDSLVEANGSLTATLTSATGGTITKAVANAIVVDDDNYAPVGNDDSYSTRPGQALTISAPGVLANDTDADGDPLAVTAVTAPTNGTVSMRADGGFDYTPDSGFVGTDTFTYYVSDGFVSTPVSVSVDVVNSAPTGADDSFSTRPGTVLNIAAPGVLANDTDADGDPLVVTAVTAPTNGTVSMRADGGFDYTPDSGFIGTDTFTYYVSDGFVSTPVSVSVDVVNSAPTGADDSFSTRPGTVLNIAAPGVLANDTDADGDPLAVTAVAAPTNGTVSMRADGGFDYTPDSGFIGTDTFTYYVSDGFVSTPVSVSVDVVNSAPTPADDNYSTTTATTLNIDAASGVLANDTDADGDPLVVTAVTAPSNGSISMLADGSFTYTPDSGFTGIETLTYWLSDGYESVSATVNISVGALTNDAPGLDVGADVTFDEGLTVMKTLLLSDTDTQARSFTVNWGDGTVDTFSTALTSVDIAHDYAFDSTFTVTVTVNDNAGASNSQESESFNVTVNNLDPDAVDDAVTVSEDAGPVNIGSPFANDTDPGNDPLMISGYAGRAPIDGSDFFDTPFVLPSGATITYTSPTMGFDDGTFVYNPNGMFEALGDGETATDTFTYSISDGDGGGDTATVTVTINGVNDAPDGVDDTATTAYQTPVMIDVLANDSDVEGDPLTITAVTNGAFGTAMIDDNGTPGDATDDRILYTPTAGFSGVDGFSYTVSDGNGGSTIVAVTVTVDPAIGEIVGTDGPENLKGTPNADTIRGLGGDDKLIGQGDDDILDGGADNDRVYGSDGNDTIIGGAGNDVLFGDNPGSAKDGRIGNDLFRFGTDDGMDQVFDFAVGFDKLDLIGSETAVFNFDSSTGNTEMTFGNTMVTFYDAMVSSSDVFVLGANVAPIAASDSASTDQDVAVTIDILGNDSDADGDTITLTSVGAATNGTVVVDDNGTAGDTSDDFVVYTPDAGFNGIDSFTYQIADGNGGVGLGEVTVSIGTVDIPGTSGADKIYGTLANENVDAMGGNDVVVTDGGNDFVDAGDGRDNVKLGDGDDTAIGGIGRDKLLGEDGDDSLDGGADNDRIYGGLGDDTITGGDGNDVMFGDIGGDRDGGAIGADLFIFDLDDGMDQVFDFATGIDQVQLVGSTSYTMLESGGNTFVTFGSTEIVFRDAILTAGDIDAIL